jgi:hypothetical protein
MHNFKDYLNFSPNAADNAYRLRQLALQEALLAEAKKKKAKKDSKKSKDADKKADKDYDGDGEIETGKKEYFGSRDKAIKKNIAKKKINESGAVEQFNDSDDRQGDERIATRPDSSKISLLNSWGGNPVDFDVSSDEGLTQALQHIQGVKTGIDASDDRSNIGQSEWDADRHNSQFLNQLTQMAKQRKLKVSHQGIGGTWVMDYSKSDLS